MKEFAVFVNISCIYIYCLYIYVVYGSLQTTVGDKLEYRSFYSRSWGVVCSSGFDDNAALVACRQLGYDNGSYYTSAYFG